MKCEGVMQEVCAKFVEKHVERNMMCVCVCVVRVRV
jgi:hypothetical protein